MIEIMEIIGKIATNKEFLQGNAVKFARFCSFLRHNIEFGFSITITVILLFSKLILISWTLSRLQRHVLNFEANLCD